MAVWILAVIYVSRVTFPKYHAYGSTGGTLLSFPLIPCPPRQTCDGGTLPLVTPRLQKGRGERTYASGRILYVLQDKEEEKEKGRGRDTGSTGPSTG